MTRRWLARLRHIPLDLNSRKSLWNNRLRQISPPSLPAAGLARYSVAVIFLEVLSDPLPSAATPDPGPLGGFYDLFVVLDLEDAVESVPEPSTFVLSALGALGLLALGFHRRHRGGSHSATSTAR